MSELYMMTTITNRNTAKKFMTLYEQHGIHVSFFIAAGGTAASEMLDYFGLEQTEKAMILSVVTQEVWEDVKKGLQREIKIDIPGMGIAFVIPLSSIGGKKQVLFLTENQNFVKGEESALKGTKYEMLVIVTNQGYTEQVMDIAREVGASGGTVIHAKGTGMERAEKFLGVSLAAEKEMIFMVVKSQQKNDIMRAVMQKAGMESKAKSILFSLPVLDTAGMRLTEDMED
ncbi:MAG TPA: P-II family nitrogen regulator [Firmicutes bacterium]|nr:P-II family nitrogen regulator [Bacillota bacterium]